VERYVSIDIETTGLNAEKHQILSFAAVAGNFDPTFNVSELPSMQRYFYYNDIVGDPVALAMNVEILRAMPKREKVANQEGTWMILGDLMRDFRIWLVASGFKDTTKIPVTGKNFGSFDKTFLAAAPSFNVGLFHHRMLDAGSLYFEPDLDETLPSLPQCMQRAELAEGDWNLHTALDDARVVVELIRRYYSHYRLASALAYSRRISPMLTAADARHLMTVNTTIRNPMDKPVHSAVMADKATCQIPQCNVEHLHTAIRSGYAAELAHDGNLKLKW
jgi:hypothetical protein